MDHIESLATDPYPRESVRLRGLENTYRVRVGDWRLIYQVQRERVTILVLRFLPRQGAYSRLP